MNFVKLGDHVINVAHITQISNYNIENKDTKRSVIFFSENYKIVVEGTVDEVVSKLGITVTNPSAGGA